jgi:hypothetical protein
MKPLDDVHATFKKAMEPLFDFLVDAFRESQHDRLVVASMESVWNKKFSLSLAYDVVSTRSVD